MGETLQRQDFLSLVRLLGHERSFNHLVPSEAGVLQSPPLSVLVHVGGDAGVFGSLVRLCQGKDKHRDNANDASSDATDGGPGVQCAPCVASQDTAEWILVQGVLIELLRMLGRLGLQIASCDENTLLASWHPAAQSLSASAPSAVGGAARGGRNEEEPNARHIYPSSWTPAAYDAVVNAQTPAELNTIVRNKKKPHLSSASASTSASALSATSFSSPYSTAASYLPATTFADLYNHAASASADNPRPWATSSTPMPPQPSSAWTFSSQPAVPNAESAKASDFPRFVPPATISPRTKPGSRSSWDDYAWSRPPRDAPSADRETSRWSGGDLFDPKSVKEKPRSDDDSYLSKYYARKSPPKEEPAKSQETEKEEEIRLKRYDHYKSLLDGIRAGNQRTGFERQDEPPVAVIHYSGSRSPSRSPSQSPSNSPGKRRPAKIVTAKVDSNYAKAAKKSPSVQIPTDYSHGYDLTLRGKPPPQSRTITSAIPGSALKKTERPLSAGKRMPSPSGGQARRYPS